jgi:hypothetical protein
MLLTTTQLQGTRGKEPGQEDNEWPEPGEGGRRVEVMCGIWRHQRGVHEENGEERADDEDEEGEATAQVAESRPALVRHGGVRTVAVHIISPTKPPLGPLGL